MKGSELKFSVPAFRISFSLSALCAVLAFCTLISGCGGSASPEKTDNQPQPKELVILKKAPMPDFEFMNQDSQLITPASLTGKVQVMDFFFTSCPTICPTMKANMLTLYEKYKDEDRVILVSHSIDTRHDSVPVLKEYAERLEVRAPRWNFVTGDKEEIMQIARDYLVSAMEDKKAPGGYAHSGTMILFDKDRNIRGFYDGTSAKETATLSEDIGRLLKE